MTTEAGVGSPRRSSAVARRRRFRSRVSIRSILQFRACLSMSWSIRIRFAAVARARRSANSLTSGSAERTSQKAARTSSISSRLRSHW
jgi:hypothetical protein